MIAGPRSRRVTVAGVRYALLIGAAVVLALPFGYMVSTSLKAHTLLLEYPPRLIPTSPTLDNYAAIFVEQPFLKYFWNSLWIGLASAAFSLAIGSLAAYSIARFRTGGQPFSLTVLGTQMLPPVVLVIPFYLLAQRFGLLDKGWALALVYLSFNLPFVVWILIGFFQGIPRELDEAAIMDGCGPLRIFLKVILPLSTPVLATAAVFSFIWTWDDFFAPLIYLNDIGKYTAQLGLRTFVDSTGTSDWGALFAMSTLTVLPIFILFILFQRLLIEGIATTGMKR